MQYSLKTGNATPSQRIPERKTKKTLIALLIGALLVGVIILSNSSRQESRDDRSLMEVLKDSPTPTPFLFAELTIPHLRSREYKSALGPLSSVRENQAYTGYLTSYDSDNLKINAFLTKPTGQEPKDGWPAIVFVHGYIPPTQYQTLGQYASYVDYLARAGFVVFKIDLRGHGDSEGEPGGAYYSSDYIVDVLNAYAALQGADFINPKRIGLWGHSMAGNVVTRSFAAKPDIPAVSVWAGAVYTYSDRLKYGINDGSYMPPPNDSERQRKRKLLLDTYGEFSEESAFWKQVPATNYLQDLKGAIQINHAVDDPVVSIGYSRDFISLLDKTSVPHKLKEYPSGGHNFTGATFTQAMDATIAFFKKYLR